jgi:basic amino acid/polyamine antiporter, APA family
VLTARWLFPRAFAWTDRKDSAWFGILIAAALPSLLMLWRYTSSSGLTVFTYLVNLTVVAVALPHLFSACAQLTYLVSRRRRVNGWLLARDLSVAGISALFSMWVTFAPGSVRPARCSPASTRPADGAAWDRDDGQRLARVTR